MRNLHRLALASVAVLSVLAAACGGGGEDAVTPGPPTTTEPQAGEVTVEAADNAFEPSTLTATAGQQLTVNNTGAAIHNVSIAENNVDFDIQPGESETEDAFEGLAPGDYEFVCKYHESLGMVGTVTITG
jgi:plastocyanin